MADRGCRRGENEYNDSLEQIKGHATLIISSSCSKSELSRSGNPRLYWINRKKVNKAPDRDTAVDEAGFEVQFRIPYQLDFTAETKHDPLLAQPGLEPGLDRLAFIVWPVLFGGKYFGRSTATRWWDCLEEG